MNSSQTPEPPNQDEKQSIKYRQWPASGTERPVGRGTIGGNPAFTVLRIVLWLLPTIIVPAVVVCCIYVLSQLRIYMLQNLFAFILSVAAVAAIGYFDQRIELQQKGIELAREKDKITKRVVIFVICQVFITPVIWFTLLYGYCIVSDIAYL